MNETAAKTQRRGPLALVVLLTAAAAVLIWVQHHRVRDAGVTPQEERPGARELALTTLAGDQWRLSAERGHVVAVNLWATWCAPCREETPMLVRVSTELAPAGLRVIGLSLDTGGRRDGRVRDFATAMHVRYPMAFPDSLSQMESGLEGIPTTLLFDRQGRPAKVYVGQLSERVFRRDVAALLREP